MNREEAKSEFFKVIESGRIDFTEYNVIDMVYNDFENAKCGNCKWLQDEVCVNSYSLMCSDYPNIEMMCNKYEKNKMEK